MPRPAPDLLPGQRLRLLLDQLRVEWDERHGDSPGFQRDAAKKTGMSESQVSKLVKGERAGGDLKTLFDVIRTMKIRPDFFFDEALSEPHYRQFVKSRGPKLAPVSEAWATFLEIGGPKKYGLTTEQTEWLRTAPFRGGAQSVDDYIAAARAITKATAQRPPGWAEAEADEGDE
ncbi:Hypothetical protein I5071_35130 [Sandaracinus amylolyticus]|nr:Hypothetical protein I5071_35130 [Sandaracinus amylolyticus]